VRRPGRPPGISDTRERILANARELFAHHGIDRTSIRAIAAAAGVDSALVHHYFGTKQQLFVAAMELPVDLEATAPRILAGPPDEIGLRLARFILELWDQPATRQLMLGVVRSASSDEVAAGMLRRILAEGPFAVMARAIDLPDADLRATLVGSQLVGLSMARYIVAVEPLASADPETIARAIGPTLQRYLVGELEGA
jgi:AcrR family transcriptional regulator